MDKNIRAQESYLVFLVFRSTASYVYNAFWSRSINADWFYKHISCAICYFSCAGTILCAPCSLAFCSKDNRYAILASALSPKDSVFGLPHRTSIHLFCAYSFLQVFCTLLGLLHRGWRLFFTGATDRYYEDLKRADFFKHVFIIILLTV